MMFGNRSNHLLLKKKVTTHGVSALTSLIPVIVNVYRVPEIFASRLAQRISHT